MLVAFLLLVLFVCTLWIAIMNAKYFRIYCGYSIPALILVLIFVFIFMESPIEDATNKSHDVAELKLATIQDYSGTDCNVFRDAKGNYYFVTEEIDKYGKGNSEFKGHTINAKSCIVVESESDDVTDAYVDIDEVDAKISVASLGIKPITRYTFVVPKDAIRFVQEIPE